MCKIGIYDLLQGNLKREHFPILNGVWLESLDAFPPIVLLNVVRDLVDMFLTNKKKLELDGEKNSKFTHLSWPPPTRKLFRYPSNVGILLF